MSKKEKELENSRIFPHIPEGNIESSEYYIGADTSSVDIKAYCLMKRKENGDIEILLSKSTTDSAQFERDIKDIERLFNVKTI